MSHTKTARPRGPDVVAAEIRQRLIKAEAERHRAAPQSRPHEAAGITAGDPTAFAIAAAQIEVLSDLGEALTRRFAESDTRLDSRAFRRACGLDG